MSLSLQKTIVADASERLDLFLTRSFTDYSRTYFQALISDEKVTINGLLPKKRSILNIGDEVRVNFTPSPPLELEAENIPLNIIYEDSDLIVLNKAVGMVVHPGAGNPKGTLVNALMYHCDNKYFNENSQLAEGDALRPGIVHRLDRDTSGIMVVAKSECILRQLSSQFAQRQVKKTYHLIVYGGMPSSDVKGVLVRDKRDRKRYCMIDEPENQNPAIGKWSWSSFELLNRLQGDLYYLSATLHTGRTHQLRVHARASGCPILGDSLYGSQKINNRYGASRQYLHAYQLTFHHPKTGKLLEFSADLPQDMRVFLRKNHRVE